VASILGDYRYPAALNLAHEDSGRYLRLWQVRQKTDVCRYTRRLGGSDESVRYLWGPAAKIRGGL